MKNIFRKREDNTGFVKISKLYKFYKIEKKLVTYTEILKKENQPGKKRNLTLLLRALVN